MMRSTEIPINAAAVAVRDRPHRLPTRVYSTIARSTSISHAHHQGYWWLEIVTPSRAGGSGGTSAGRTWDRAERQDAAVLEAAARHRWR